MKSSLLNEQNLSLARVCFRSNWNYAVTSIIIMLMSINVFAQQRLPNQYQISIKSKSFVPVEGIERTTLSYLNSKIVQEKIHPHAIMQFNASLTRQQREELKIRGVTLLSYVGGNAWYVTVSDTNALRFSDRVIKSRFPTLNQIRWIGKIAPVDKISSFFETYGPGEWAKNSDGTIRISVDFFEDVTREEARAILKKYGAAIESERNRRVSFYITVTPGVIDSMAGEDKVKKIDAYPAPKTMDNDGSRARTHTDQVFNHVAKSDATINIEGNGVTLGIWDGNEVDDMHRDLMGRVIYGQNPRTNVNIQHSTHVAGTMAGNGTVNNNLQGHAPQATSIISYDFDGSVPDEMDDALDNYAISSINNSWGSIIGWFVNQANLWQFNNNQSQFGDYTGESEDFDDLVRQRKVNIIFAVGNDRDDPSGGIQTPAHPADWDQGSGNNGYATIATPSTAKNTISVGAINDANGAMAGFSNWGPTDDGRIKPDIVAPGVGIVSCDNDGNDNAPNDINNTYMAMDGTSMAAPAVTGITALLIETYRDEYFNNISSTEVPLPSTIKALLINSAHDLGNPGPDYQFGWGEVNAEAAYNLLRNRLLLESQLYTGEEDVFLCNVPANTDQMRVTICWDDYKGSNLKNDLDLTLEDPSGNINQPWLLDPSAANRTNNATTGTDRVNNVEQVSVANPAAGLWKIKINGYNINEPVANPFQKYSLVSDFPFYKEEKVSVVQTIDRTGSMSHRDDSSLPTYMESAKTAAQNFLRLMQIGDEAGVISFDDPDCDYQNGQAETLFKLSELSSESVRNTAISSIDGLNPRGCTSIAAGLKLAQYGPDFLDKASVDNPQAIILLSDGFENTTPWVSDIMPLPDKTDVYTIALGPLADVNLLRDIADQTKGKYYESPTILGLLSIYYQIQGDLELGEAANMEIGTKESGNDTRKVLIDQGASQATFAVGWLQNEARLNITLKDPNGTDFGSNQTGVVNIESANSCFWRILNPKAGEWEVHITRTDANLSKVNYTFATFVKDVSKTWSFVPSVENAGDCLMTKVYLFDTKSGKPIKGARVEAIVTSPESSLYTLHYNYLKPSAKSWNYKSLYTPRVASVKETTNQVSGEKYPNYVSTLTRLNTESISKTGNSIFRYKTSSYKLYDDGTNGDETDNDGYYSFCIPNTEIAGSYNISFKITGVTEEASEFTRQILSTSVIQPAIADPSKILARIDPQQIPLKEGSEGMITVVPMDRYGNLLGPGYSSRITISPSAGQLKGTITDNGDGFYYQKLSSTGLEKEGKLIVSVDGIKAINQPVFYFGMPFKKYSVSFHGGTSIPLGNLADTFNVGISTLIDLGYNLTSRLALVGYFGYNRFKSKLTGTSDSYCFNISLNIKYRTLIPRMPKNNLFYYVETGPGYYIPKTGKKGYGMNVGAGLNYDYQNWLTFELGSDLHTMLNRDYKFIQTHLGLIFRF